jgi:hypothetical protein
MKTTRQDCRLADAVTAEGPVRGGPWLTPETLSRRAAILKNQRSPDEQVSTLSVRMMSNAELPLSTGRSASTQAGAISPEDFQNASTSWLSSAGGGEKATGEVGGAGLRVSVAAAVLAHHLAPSGLDAPA